MLRVSKVRMLKFKSFYVRFLIRGVVVVFWVFIWMLNVILFFSGFFIVVVIEFIGRIYDRS